MYYDMIKHIYIPRNNTDYVPDEHVFEFLTIQLSNQAFLIGMVIVLKARDHSAGSKKEY